MLYLIDGDLCFLGQEDENKQEDGQFDRAEFQRIKELKNKLTPEQLCQESPEALTFLPFLQEVWSYRFDQTPDYAKLKNLLLQCLSNVGSKVDNVFDWNEEYEKNKLANESTQSSSSVENKSFDDNMCIDSPQGLSQGISAQQFKGVSGAVGAVGV